MDSAILIASLISFLALIASWLALPASTAETAPIAHGMPARA
jgi:hypothetical protein